MNSMTCGRTAEMNEVRFLVIPLGLKEEMRKNSGLEGIKFIPLILSLHYQPF